MAPAGTVAEQRARLPPPAECTDPVEGIWKSHDFDSRWGEWTVFTLEIHRKEGSDDLEGKIFNHSWYGEKGEPEPPVCKGRLRFKVSMDAEGTVTGNEINFHGVGQWRMDEVICGTWSAGYNLDNFSGTIDPDILEFQSVNNDGGRAINDPTVFRRIECFKDGESKQDDEPRIAMAPPAFYPPEEGQSGGCNFR